MKGLEVRWAVCHGSAMTSSILYSGLTLDRAHNRRRASELNLLMALPTIRVAPYWRGRQLITGQPPTAAWAEGRAAARLMASGGSRVFLGMDGEVPVVAVDVSALEAGEDGPDLGFGGRWALLRSVGSLLPAEDACRLAYARGLLVWHERTRFCSVCGTRIELSDGGHVAQCSAQECGAQHFPRTDAAIIVLVTDRHDRVLLGRQAIWAPGMYSCLAGFVEPGETLEEAVAREVMEESGIRITAASYVASQPWPFPSSLMIGFTARAEDGEPVADAHELEDARWFTRAEIAEFGEAHAPGPQGLFLPRPESISRALIDGWLRNPPSS
jgi:NAD+ diphosphatase